MFNPQIQRTEMPPIPQNTLFSQLTGTLQRAPGGKGGSLLNHERATGPCACDCSCQCLEPPRGSLGAGRGVGGRDRLGAPSIGHPLS